ncbi:MAG: primosomal protein N', partial [Desulfobacterales bacterium]|nr:primosomal protein N' [Desulfobacterales bacterium]
KEAAIAVGARSAIFAPFTGPILVIVDEEHDASYKQENKPRYNARDLALVRAKLSEGAALLGSATPSMESYFNMSIGKFHALRLTKRVESRPLPGIRLIDLRETRDLRGPRRFISPELLEGMREALSRGDQVLLFLNRRGFATFPVCATCGDSIRCKHCDITLTLHKGVKAYKCHYCGYSLAYGALCPTCGSSKIKLMGMGTEKVAEAARAFFPEARIARMDRDTTTRKGSILKILKSLKKRAVDILVGTQMVAKGHDFPHITLVGVICADLSLSFPDFRASERTFQLLAQVAGRAGRGDKPGKVILQTYTPDHYSILAAKSQDFQAFYTQEIPFREALNYPPHSRMVQLKISGKDKEKTAHCAQTVGELCRTLMEENPLFSRAIEIMGPIESPLQKIAGRHRWQILLKGPRAGPLHRFVRRLLSENRSLFNNRAVRVNVDVDPYYLL